MTNRQKPNIIIIYPDSLMAHALGCYENSNPVSPNIDALAESGVRFTNCISSNPVCQPSRASFHTGCYVDGHNVRNNSTEHLSSIYPTMAQVFRNGGYQLAYYGKTHSVNQNEWDDVFDLYPDYNKYLQKHGIDIVYPEQPPVDSLCAGISSISNENFSENILGDLGENYIRNRADKEKPFMLFMSHEAPHSPWTVPQKYADFLSNDDIVLPEVPEEAWASKHPELKAYLEKRSGVAYSDDQLKYAIRIYQTLIKIVDDNVGKLLCALEETGQRDNTVIIVSSDHGDYLGNFRAMGKCISSADNLLRVPLIFNAPKQWTSHVNQSLVQNVDIFPTLAAIAGLDVPCSVHGQDLAAALNGGNSGRKYAFSEEHSDYFDSWMVAQDERWKLVYYVSGREEIYDLHNDPHEWYNLIEKDEIKQIRDRLKDELLRWRFKCIDRKTPQKGSFVKDFMKPGCSRY